MIKGNEDEGNTPDKITREQNASFSIYHWRNILIFCSLILRFVFALQTSYIHPDEFFQSFQPIYQDNIPWEFKDVDAINRSIVPLYITHFPMITLGTWLNLKPLAIYLLVRLQYCFMTWLCIDWCLYRIMPIKHERIKAIFFTTTSYMTLVFQSHTFSNSLETCLLIIVIYLINDMREFLETRDSYNSYSSKKLMLLGILISFGIFNRITFPCWILFPSIYLFKFFIKYPLKSVIPVVCFMLTTTLIVILDTLYFTKLPLCSINTSNLIIAPLNNFLYNMNNQNLSLHGLHPRYTHILINYPQMVGPLLFLLFPFSCLYIKTTTFLSFTSGILLLSLIPHQELRFLQPALPLIATTVSFVKNGSFSKYYKPLIILWLIFNFILGIFFGMVHQAGIVPSIDAINSHIYSNNISNPTLIFWRTYKPPTWMLNSNSKKIYFEIENLTIDELNCNSNSTQVIDLMGGDLEILNDVLKKVKCFGGNNVFLVTPFNAILNLQEESYQSIWNTAWHLDMDHFEFDKFGFKTFVPGLGLYDLI